MKPRLGKWILVNLEGISHTFSMIFSTISKISINVHEYGYNKNIICMSKYQIKLLCPGINLVLSLVFLDKMLWEYEYLVGTTPFLKVE